MLQLSKAAVCANRRARFCNATHRALAIRSHVVKRLPPLLRQWFGDEAAVGGQGVSPCLVVHHFVGPSCGVFHLAHSPQHAP